MKVRVNNKIFYSRKLEAFKEQQSNFTTQKKVQDPHTEQNWNQICSEKNIYFRKLIQSRLGTTVRMKIKNKGYRSTVKLNLWI